MQKKELRRSVRANTLEIRANTDGTTTVGGYAAVYESASQPLPFLEVLRRGAFKRTLKDGNEKFLIFGHDMNQPLARESNGSLSLSEDSKGLKFEATLNSSPRSQQLVADLRSGLITDMSFGFLVDEDAGDRDTWTQDSKGVTRYIESCTLFEISAVLEGAYSAPSISLRSAPAAIRERLKRDAGDASDVSDVDPLDDDTDEDTQFELCSDCRAGLCTRCAGNFRSSKRTAVDLQGLPMRGGICLRCVRSLCQRCFDAYQSALNEDDPDTNADARSRRQMAALLLRMAAQ